MWFRRDVLVTDRPDKLAPRWKRLLTECVLVALALCAATVAATQGLHLRENLWRESAPIRFRGDIANALNIGSRVLHESKLDAGLVPAKTATVSWRQFFHGYLGFYDNLARRHSDANYGVDYPPLRLLVMSAWVKHLSDQGRTWTGYDDSLAQPLLWLNTIFEGAACALLFALVWVWNARVGRRRGWLLGLIAALLLWFNPCVLLEAHGWPQWDVWVLPFYVGAMLAATCDRFFIAGLLLAAGAMLKGQIVLVAPIFVLWPLFQLRFGAACRVVSGFATGTAVIASPWLLNGAAAWVWTGAISAAFGACAIRWLPTALRWHTIPLIAIGAGTGAFFIWDGSLAWLDVGFGYANRHYPAMVMGPTSNIPALLQQIYNWQIHDIAATVRLPREIPLVGSQIDVTMKLILGMAYILTLLLCGMGAAIHARRNDPMLLISLVAPWVLMFAINVQMHERYLFWGATLGVVAITASRGLLAMHAVIATLALLMIGHNMLEQNVSFAPRLLHFARSARPGIGWAVVLCALVYLFAAVCPRRRLG